MRIRVSEKEYDFLKLLIAVGKSVLKTISENIVVANKSQEEITIIVITNEGEPETILK